MCFLWTAAWPDNLKPRATAKCHWSAACRVQTRSLAVGRMQRFGWSAG